MRHISKRAFDFSKFTSYVMDTLWQDSRGPWENLFNIISHAAPFIPGVGWVVWGLLQIAEIMNVGLPSLGAKIDRWQGKGPGDDIADLDFDEVGAAFASMSATSSSISDDTIEKFALLGGLLKVVGGIPRVFKGLKAVFKWILLAFGVNKFSELYGKFRDDKEEGARQDPILQMFEPSYSEEEGVILTPEQAEEEERMYQ